MTETCIACSGTGQVPGASQGDLWIRCPMLKGRWELVPGAMGVLTGAKRWVRGSARDSALTGQVPGASQGDLWIRCPLSKGSWQPVAGAMGVLTGAKHWVRGTCRFGRESARDNALDRRASHERHAVRQDKAFSKGVQEALLRHHVEKSHGVPWAIWQGWSRGSPLATLALTADQDSALSNCSECLSAAGKAVAMRMAGRDKARLAEAAVGAYHPATV